MAFKPGELYKGVQQMIKFGLWDQFNKNPTVGAAENISMMTSSIPSMTAAGVAGLQVPLAEKHGKAPTGYYDNDGRWQPSVVGNVTPTPADYMGYKMDSLMYQPRSTAARGQLESLGRGFQAVADTDAAKAIERNWYDVTAASPLLATSLMTLANIADPTHGKIKKAVKVRGYHGTTADFDTFNTPAMFSTKREYAEQLAQGPGGRVIEADIELQNPADLRALEISPSDPNFPQIAEQLKAAGYDGAQYRDEAYIAFDNAQIKQIDNGKVKSPEGPRYYRAPGFEGGAPPNMSAIDILESEIERGWIDPDKVTPEIRDLLEGRPAEDLKWVSPSEEYLWNEFGPDEQSGWRGLIEDRSTIKDITDELNDEGWRVLDIGAEPEQVLMVRDRSAGKSVADNLVSKYDQAVNARQATITQLEESLKAHEQAKALYENPEEREIALVDLEYPDLNYQARMNAAQNAADNPYPGKTFAEIYRSSLAGFQDELDKGDLSWKRGKNEPAPTAPPEFDQDAYRDTKLRLERAQEEAYLRESGEEANVLADTFLNKDDSFWGIEMSDVNGGHSFKNSGYSAVECTGYACEIRDRLGKDRVDVYGFSAKDNPDAAVIGEIADGHDFAVVDGRYIVDPWVVDVESVGKGVYDLQNPADLPEIKAIYGDQKKWKRQAGSVEETGGGKKVYGQVAGRQALVEMLPDASVEIDGKRYHASDKGGSSKLASDGSEALITVDRDLLEALMNESNELVGPGPDHRNQIGKRVAQFKEYWSNNDDITVGNFYFSPKRGLQAGNGRHRTRVMLESGMQRIPITMPKADVAKMYAYAMNKGLVDVPTTKAYKLFRVDEKRPGELLPLFVNPNESVPMNQWVAADTGPITQRGKVSSKLGELAYRPGWHAGDLPVATHIGEGGQPPTRRRADQVWGEVEMPADYDWQSVANERATRNKKGEIIPRTAHVTDTIPAGGHYRYKTNPNMTGEWLISGNMRVNRLLPDAEVQKLNEGSTPDLPREADFEWHRYGFFNPANEADINVGLDIRDQRDAVSVDEIREWLEGRGIEIVNSGVKRSNTENTFTARLSRPLSPQESYDLSKWFDQEAIVQRQGGFGKLYGPKAHAWGEYNPDYFQDPPQKPKKWGKQTGHVEDTGAGKDVLEGIAGKQAVISGLGQSTTRKEAEAAAKAAGKNVTRQDLLDTPEAVAERVRRAREAMKADERVPLDLDLMRRDSIFPRDLIDDAMHGHPGVPQTQLERAKAKTEKKQQEIDERVSGVFSDPLNRDLIIEQVNRGRLLGGDTYYPSTYALRGFLEDRLPDGGKVFEQNMHAHAGTSPQTALPNNMASQSMIMAALNAGIDLNDYAALKRFADQFAQSMGWPKYFIGQSHAENVVQLMNDIPGVGDKDKIKSYDQDLLGNFRNTTFDTHEAKGSTLGSEHHPYYEKKKGAADSEYGAFEQGYQDVAGQLGLEPGNLQASRWFGGGPLTGLKAGTGDWLSTFEHMVMYTAEKMGHSMKRSALQQLALDILTGKQPMPAYYPTKTAPLPKLSKKVEAGFIDKDMLLTMAGLGVVGAGAYALHSEAKKRTKKLKGKSRDLLERMEE